jgi:hypothetical protein
LERKITVDFVDTPLDDAIAYFRTISNVNIIADREVMEKPLAVNMRIKDMKTVDALIWMLKLVELEFELKDSALYIRKAADAGKQQPAAKLPPPPSDF